MKRPYVIIGGGIVGSSIAYHLAREGCDVCVLEKEPAVALHASGRNSGVLHSGINYRPRSEKSNFCIAGNYETKEFCRAEGVPFNECGTIVIARSNEEKDRLKTQYNLIKTANIPGLRYIEKKGIEEIFEREPAITKEAREAIFSPTGAIVDSPVLTAAIAARAQKHGARYIFNAEVNDIKGLDLITTCGDIKAGHIVNAAGLYADKMAHMMGIGKEHRVIPFLGKYWQVCNVPINSMVYVAPNLQFPFLGVHFTASIDGRVLAGPNSALALGRESYNGELNFQELREAVLTKNFARMAMSRKFLKMAYENSLTAFFQSRFLAEIQSLTSFPVEARDILPYRAGIRAQMVSTNGQMLDDLVVEYRENSTHVINAVSPSMTCALPFGRKVAETIVKRKY
ncbi:MAG: L-2-hydroxyglutarate oxidase [Nanoarchaeota archaeon]|nr:L-2-hydroxyglutarate oxidase [Nanoarchaeota archaeon]